MKNISDYKIGDLIQMHEFGSPVIKKVLAVDESIQKIQLGYTDGNMGSSWASNNDILYAASRNLKYQETRRRHDLFDQYNDTDGFGQCYSDADIGL